MRRVLLRHHRAWVEAHPHRTDAWFLARLEEGFDVHHIDADHTNNDPDNLVLIETTDHHRLHGRRLLGLPRLERTAARHKAQAEAAEKRREAGELAFTLRVTGMGWWKIAKECGLANEAETRLAGQEYAQRNGYPWPPLSNNDAKNLRRRTVKETAQ